MERQETQFELQEFVRKNVWQMRGYVPGEQPQGGKFIKLNTNENPYPPSPLATIPTQGLEEKLRKYPDPFATAFRQQTAKQLDVSADQILCGNGSDEILGLIIRLFLEPGDIARWSSPTYLLYRTLIQMHGAIAEEVSYGPDWSLQPAFFQGSPKLVFLANPNSPSGTCFDLAALASIISRFRCPVVIDEAYADFAGQTAVDLIKDFPNLIVSRTLSKSYALAGLRFGYMVASEALIAQTHKIRDSYNCDAIATAIATAAVTDQQWLLANVQKIVSQRQSLQTHLTQLGFKVQPSQANFLWCQHPDFQAEDLYNQLKLRQILVRLMNYGEPFVGIRITVGTPEQNDVLIGQLKQVLGRS